MPQFKASTHSLSPTLLLWYFSLLASSRSRFVWLRWKHEHGSPLFVLFSLTIPFKFSIIRSHECHYVHDKVDECVLLPLSNWWKRELVWPFNWSHLQKWGSHAHVSINYVRGNADQLCEIRKYNCTHNCI